MILRLSQKLNKKIEAGNLGEMTLDENPNADWSCHLFTTDQTQQSRRANSRVGVDPTMRFMITRLNKKARRDCSRRTLRMRYVLRSRVPTPLLFDRLRSRTRIGFPIRGFHRGRDDDWCSAARRRSDRAYGGPGGESSGRIRDDKPSRNGSYCVVVGNGLSGPSGPDCCCSWNVESDHGWKRLVWLRCDSRRGCGRLCHGPLVRWQDSSGRKLRKLRRLQRTGSMIVVGLCRFSS